MDNEFKKSFIKQWKKYFKNAELPICYYYTNHANKADIDDTKNEDRCLIGNLKRVRKGHAFVFDAKSPGCTGGKRYSGFSQKLRPNFEYFLSCGIPGEMEGERYKKSPELVKEYLRSHPPFEAPGKYLVFKRWDRLGENEEPAAVIFFTEADVLAGLFTLANYDNADPHGVTAPMGAGCGSIIGYPFEESKSNNPRCVLGMFDISARPHVPPETLTFTIPMKRFKEMVNNIKESFLITESWKLVRKRLK